MRIRIATRKSPLAVWQAEHVASLIGSQFPKDEVELVKLTTTGDKILDQSLSKVGGKDLFVKEIEAALLDGRADIAVHSLKDVPTVLPEALEIRAMPKREDPRDALVSDRGFTLTSLPPGARVGTCSLRRAAQLLRQRSDLEIVPIRGNVQTRLQKMRAENMDATILAFAGLRRLGLERLATEVLGESVCLPAIGQGILAVECRRQDEAIAARLQPLDDADTRVCGEMERAFLHTLEGGCQIPIAGHAKAEGDRVRMRGLVSTLDGHRVVEDLVEGPRSEAKALGAELAERLLGRGAREILNVILGR